MSINSLFNISRNSLQVYQHALNVTSNNIANANNQNYSRQKINFGSEKDVNIRGRLLGAGVSLSDISRVKNQLTESQIRNYTYQNSFSKRQSTLLGSLESILGEQGNNGLASKLSKFFSSWDELSTNPQSQTLRNNVVNAAQNFSDKLQNIYSSFNKVKSDSKAEADKYSDLINNYSQEIKTLNEQIYKSNNNGSVSNELLDRRDELINNLSEIANVNVSTTNDNLVNVSVGGVLLVSGTSNILVKAVEENGNIFIKTKDDSSKLQLTSGELGAVVQTANQVIPNYLKQLDSIASNLIESVNSVHKTGYGITNPPQTGINFFESYEGGVLKLNSNILTNNNLIAASSDSSNGNNSIAVSIAELKDLKLEDGQTLSEKYFSFVSDLGNKIKNNDDESESFGLILQQLEQQKSDESGVSVDEEMVNMLKFQRSYDASAKLIKIVDDMLQTILNVVS